MEQCERREQGRAKAGGVRTRGHCPGHWPRPKRDYPQTHLLMGKGGAGPEVRVHLTHCGARINWLASLGEAG